MWRLWYLIMVMRVMFHQGNFFLFLRWNIPSSEKVLVANSPSWFTSMNGQACTKQLYDQTDHWSAIQHHFSQCFIKKLYKSRGGNFQLKGKFPFILECLFWTHWLHSTMVYEGNCFIMQRESECRWAYSKTFWCSWQPCFHSVIACALMRPVYLHTTNVIIFHC